MSSPPAADPQAERQPAPNLDGPSPPDGSKPEPPQAQAPPPSVPAPAQGGSSSKKKKKKNKKASVAVPSSAPPAPASTGQTPTAPSEPKGVTEPHDVTAPQLQPPKPTATPDDKAVSAAPVTAGQALPQPESASATTMQVDAERSVPASQSETVDEEQPNFGDHVEGGLVHQPQLGVPAPMPPQASSLFVDEAEDMAFLISDNKEDNIFEVPPPEVPRSSTPPQSIAPDVPPPPLVDDDVEEAAFDSTATLDPTLEAIGRKHEEQAVAAAGTPSKSPALAPVTPGTARTEDLATKEPVEKDSKEATKESAGTAEKVTSPRAEHKEPTSKSKEDRPTPSAAALFTDDGADDAFPVGTEEPAASRGVGLPEKSTDEGPKQPRSKETDPSAVSSTAKEGGANEGKGTEDSPREPAPSTAAALLTKDTEDDAFDIGITEQEGKDEIKSQPQAKEPASAPSKDQQTSVNALFAESGKDDDFSIGGEQPEADQVSDLKPREAESRRARRPISLFDTDDQAEFDIPGQEGESPKEETTAAKTPAATLFGNEAGDETFDIGQPEEADGPSGARTAGDPGRSQPKDVKKRDVSNLFSDDDFLNDTSIDESFQFDSKDLPQSSMQSSTAKDVEAEVPQGWYDDGGNWNWYTVEEREAVRQAMIADGSLKVTASDENQARRTPAAESQSYAPSSSAGAAPVNPYSSSPANPYAPPAQQPVANPYAPASATQGYQSTPSAYSGYQAQSQPAQSPYGSMYTPATGAVSGYGYSAAPPPAAPAAPAFTPAVGYATQPYATTPAATPYDPYAPAAGGYGATVPPAGPSALSPKKAEPLKRPTKSDAYDPPLRPKKSFIGRPGSAAAQVAPLGSFVAPPDAPPLPHAAQSAPPAPPPGPPRRSTTAEPQTLSPPSQPPSSLPASTPYDPYAPPAPPAHSQSFSAAVPQLSSGYGTGHAAAPADPYAAQRTRSPPVPSAPPQRPATSSSQHPPKPTSFDPPLRPTSSRPPSRHTARPAFSPPPAAAPPVPPIPSEYSGASHSPYPSAAPAPGTSRQPPPPAEPINPPPRGPSRGATRTPKFERPPPPSVSAPPTSVTAHHPPPRSASPQAPPRASSPAAPIRRASPIGAPPPRTASPAGGPPRVSSPLRNEPITMASLGAATEQPTPKFSQSVPLHDEQENDDYDPEGGHWEEDDEAEVFAEEETYEQKPSKAAASGHQPVQSESEHKHTPSEPQSEEGYKPSAYNPSAPAVPPTASSGYEPSPYQASPERSAPPPSSSYGRSTPSPEKTKPHDPYAVKSSPKSPPKQRKEAKSPYAPPPGDSYSPYSAPTPATSTGADPYAPSHSQQSGDDYAPSNPSQQEASHKPSDTYTPYTPSAPSQAEYNPYAPSAQSAAEPDPYTPSSSGQAKTSPYTPSRQFTTDFNPYGPSTSPKKPSTTSHSADYSSAGPPKSPQKRGSLGSVPALKVPPLKRTPSYEPSPYEPSSLGAAKPAETTSFSPMNTYDEGRVPTPPSSNYFRSGSVDATYVPQQVREQLPVSEDPLGRCSTNARNVPIARFGFGGYLVTSFPGMADDSIDAPSYGYGSHRGLVTLRPVPEVVESSALVTSTIQFPGPLVHDPSTPKGAAGDKKRREAVLSYLTSRAEEIESGLPYLKTSANKKRREEEAKLVILRLLTALVEGDGRFFGTPKAQEDIREALRSPADSAAAPAHVNGLGATHAPGGARATASQLSQLSSMLLSGDKREAAQFAASAGLWSHALLIASSVGPDLWRELVTKFSTAELGNDPQSAGLKATYMVYAGLDPTTVEGLFAAANITDDPSTDKWREVIAGLLLNGKPTDLVCLDDLGARFERAGLRSVAQVCFLLSPNSPFSDMSPAATTRHIKFVEDARDEDGAIFAEIAEYARSLVPVPKGAEVPQVTLPELLPFKLQRAWRAAELGDVDQAKRYCEAIETAAKPGAKGAPSTRLPGHLRSGVEDLLERLTGSPSANPSRGLGRSKSRGGATIGSWIEGRLTKFIAGEDEGEEAPKKAVAPTSVGTNVPVGPFSHFSAISPNPSAGVSRAPSTVEGESFQGMSSATTASTGYEPYGGGGGGGYTPWEASGDAQEPPTSAQTDYSATTEGGEFINPMASFTPAPTAPAAPANNTYAPPAKKSEPSWDEDEDDLGFGNSALSRSKTPKVEPDSGTPDAYKPAPKKEEPKKQEEEKKPDDKGKKGWFGGWFGGKKDGEHSGPVRANLGEESKMYYDPELKRWLVKGAEKPAAASAPPPPPPRTATATPASRPATAPRPGGGSMPPSAGGSPHGAPHAHSAAPPGRAGPPTAPSTPAPGGGPPGAKPPVASLDDLLNRPPSGRPSSGATKKKRAGNRYVDVFNKE